MRYPRLHAYPTELIPATIRLLFACHVYAPLILFNGPSTLGTLLAKCLNPFHILGFLCVFVDSFCRNITFTGLVLGFYTFETPSMFIWTDNIPYKFWVMRTVLTPRCRTPLNNFIIFTIGLRNNLQIFFTGFLTHHFIQKTQG
jgi:hypothetical protein